MKGVWGETFKYVVVKRDGKTGRGKDYERERLRNREKDTD